MALFEVRAEISSVDAFSTERIPFEPKGWKRTFRDELAAALRTLDPGGDQMLRATYRSTDRSTCDVENVAVYNVGTGAFARAARNGLAIERCFAESLDRAEARHSWSYELVARSAPWRLWRPEALLASWTATPLPGLSSSTKVAALWWQLRQSNLQPAHPVRDIGAIGVDLSIGLNSGSRSFAPASQIKVLVDAAISSLHAHDGSNIDELSRRVAMQIGNTTEEVLARLGDPSPAVLGTRRLLWPFRTGVQWNPADDLCTAIRLTTTHGQGSAPTLTGRLYDMTSM